MKRESILQQLQSPQTWDIVVIGGGASGLGVALDAVSRGLKTLLIDRYDFGKGTSSKSTKLLHGGVRYLEKGEFDLVREGLRERYYALEKAAHISHRQQFVIPVYSYWHLIKYWIGLKIYDFLSGRFGIGFSFYANTLSTRQECPEIKARGLKGSINYFDGQFDDARLCIEIAKTIHKSGGTVANYVSCDGFEMDSNGKILRMVCSDTLSKKTFTVESQCFVNAAGTFSDKVAKLANPDHIDRLRVSRGIHLLIKPGILNLKKAILIPETEDGRVVFIIPWNGYSMVGTTDVDNNTPEIEPMYTREEVNYLLSTVNACLQTRVGAGDITSVFAGLRPLLKGKPGTKSKDVSRKHVIDESPGGLVNVLGGKWTSFRKMGEDTIDFIVQRNKVQAGSSTSSSIAISERTCCPYDPYSFDISADELVYYVDHEFCQSVEDILLRRKRLMFFDVMRAVQLADNVARQMADLLQKDARWIDEEIKKIHDIADKFGLKLIAR